MVETFVPSTQIYRDAFALSRAQKPRAAHDMFYLALALREDAVLLTLDGTLKKEARPRRRPRRLNALRLKTLSTPAHPSTSRI